MRLFSTMSSSSSLAAATDGLPAGGFAHLGLPIIGNGAEGTARSDWRAPPPLSVHHSDNEYLAAAIAAASLATTLFLPAASTRLGDEGTRSVLLYYTTDPLPGSRFCLSCLYLPQGPSS